MDLTPISQAALYVKLALLVCVMPLVVGILYAVRPHERWLALMRPLSLSAIFASVSTLLLGAVNALVYVSRNAPGSSAGAVPAIVLAETMIPSFIGFACLTAGWFSVAIGVRRST